MNEQEFAAVLDEPAPTPRAFILEFKNSFGARRYVVIALDIWQAQSAAEARIEHETSGEYPYRLVASKEVDAAAVLRVAGLDVPLPTTNVSA